MFTDAEDERRDHVVLLGHDTWEELFGDQPAIGKEVAIESGLYTVIGVLDKQKQIFGGGKNPEDNQVYFPLGTFHNLHPEDKDMWVSVKYDDPKNKSLVQEEIRDMLRIRRKVKVQADDNFEIFGPDSLTKLWGQLTGGLVLFMIAVSSVGLMVGGVGRNEHHAGLGDRAHPRNWRAKSPRRNQASPHDSVHYRGRYVVGSGRSHRTCVGAIFTWIVYFLPIGLPAALSTVWVVTGFTVSCLIGLLFGIYPAWKAANLDPIEALRYE